MMFAVPVGEQTKRSRDSDLTSLVSWLLLLLSVLIDKMLPCPVSWWLTLHPVNLFVEYFDTLVA
jgi:hypothetical protein